MKTAGPSSLFEKIWRAHVVTRDPGGRTLLYVDRHLLHDGSFHAFEAIRAAGRGVRRPERCFAMPDHYIPTLPAQRAAPADKFRIKMETLSRNTSIANTGESPAECVHERACPSPSNLVAFCSGPPNTIVDALLTSKPP